MVVIKKIYIFLKSLPSNLLVIVSLLTKFQAPSYDTFCVTYTFKIIF